MGRTHSKKTDQLLTPNPMFSAYSGAQSPKNSNNYFFFFFFFFFFFCSSLPTPSVFKDSPAIFAARWMLISDFCSKMLITNLPQNLNPGRFRHAESESEVKTLEILHPDLETKENRPKKINFQTRSEASRKMIQNNQNTKQKTATLTC